MEIIRMFDENRLRRSKEINVINDINQIIKHTFVNATLDSKGNIYGSEALIETGIHTGFSHLLAECLNVPEDKYFIISPALLYKHINVDKPRIRAIGNNRGELVFIAEDGRLLEFGRISTKIMNKDKFDNIDDSILPSKRVEGILSEDDIEALANKELLNVKINNEYLVMLSHKLIPNVSKIDSQSLVIYDSGDFFIGKFTTSMNETIVNHYYRFLKL